MSLKGDMPEEPASVRLKRFWGLRLLLPLPPSDAGCVEATEWRLLVLDEENESAVGGLKGLSC